MGDFFISWAGECSAWECDDLGHLNMRHYLTKTSQARQMTVIRLGLDEAFKTDAISSVRVDNFHIKYLGEARPGDPLRINSAVLEIGTTAARLCHMMYHADNRLAATVIETVSHISLRTREPFPWPKRVHQNAEALLISTQPAPSMPRGFKYTDVFITPNECELKSWGVKQIGAGVFQPHEMGLTGRASSQALMGRVTETLGQYKEAWPEMYQEEYRASGGSGALLEAYVIIGKPAEVGDAYHFYSAIKGADAYTRQLVHNVVNCVTGENIFSMTGFGCLFNLNTRKLVKNDEASIAELNRHAVPAFSRQDAD